ncbi:uncharacterized protein F4807DRAFT_433513 [Annulohypoxylon truncatum]|uniref:uncharacterized protein n=1 Tax=Annulohypoxylon truncatum TaxID=327061 RepID=UPI00200803CE|nr:uncharacterized protein F4807DRAFT_433513 [Annulohypoxylon truncatum]KAI1207851.1 hypothetical protein F4807DRAFT_433513 [Annulohypoxylon truncatum]
MDLKPAFNPPVPLPTNIEDFDFPSTINIYHPGYPDSYGALLRFLAVDNGGVDYDLIYYACCIITGNAWLHDGVQSHGYLAQSANSLATPITRPTDGILRGETYYFHLRTSSNEPYPIVVEFDHWVFPHGNVPLPWTKLDIYPIPLSKMLTLSKSTLEATHIRDESCRVTQSRSYNERAHIIPEAEAFWFMNNRMSRYASNPDVCPEIDDISNTMLLRPDIHKQFDLKELTLVPKKQRDKYELTLHVLHSQTHYFFEQGKLYHNRKLQLLYDVKPEFLFARFAWSLFGNKTLRIFEAMRGQIKILVRQPGSPGEDPKPVTQTARSLSQLRTPQAEGESSAANSTVSSRGKKRAASARDEDRRPYYSVSRERIIYLSGEGDLDELKCKDDVDEGELSRGRKLRRPNWPDQDSTPGLSPTVTSIASSDRISDSVMENVGVKTDSISSDLAKPVVPFKYE